MTGKLLFVASTRSHINAFHLPYLQQLHKDGWNVHCAYGGTGDSIPYADRSIPLPLKKSMTSPANFRAARILRSAILEEAYDAIIVHTTLAAFFTRSALFGLKQRPKVINMVHGYLVDGQTNWLKRTVMLAAEQLTAPVTDLVLTMNQWDYETAQRLRLGTRVEAIHGVGVNFSALASHSEEAVLTLRNELCIPHDATVLFFAAEFSANKSQEVLIRALKQLPENVYLVLAGQGDLLSHCKELAHSLNIGNRVVFPGYVNNISLWYSMADIVVASSRKEGLPFNIMEAMYMGLPVVASAVKGHIDLIRDGETGLLYPYGDDQACANQISRLIETPSLALELAHQAQAEIGQYALDQVFPQVMALYNSVLPTPVAK